MPKRILIIGPSGAGKTYVSEVLKKQGINAVDADTIVGLSGWYDSQGKEVDFPRNAGSEFLNTHQFLWDREVLADFLKDKEEVYLFGLAGNVFDMLNLFDKVYFLKVKPELIEDRLMHETRINPMGNTKYQREAVLAYAREIEKKASELGIKMIDADQTPEAIFDSLNG